MEDTLGFQVMISIITDWTDEILIDTMDIVTENGLQQVIIKLDTDVITTVAEVHDQVFTTFVYPNPLNTSTNININLSNDENVSIDIYSVTGQKVASVFDGGLSKGEHQFTWNTRSEGNELSDGVYLLKVTTENQTEIKKLILMK